MGSSDGITQRHEQLRKGLAAPVLHIDLQTKLKELRGSHAYEESDHSALTLVKEPDFRIVLIALKAGGRLEEHQATARVSIHALEGLLRMTLPDLTLELQPGHVLVLAPDIPHSVEAARESAILLTVAWAGHAAAGQAGS